MDETIVEYLRKHHDLLIGERRAEEVKLALASAWPVGERRTMEVNGRDLGDGLPKRVTITDEEIRDALGELVTRIIETIRTCLEQTLPELARPHRRWRAAARLGPSSPSRDSASHHCGP